MSVANNQRILHHFLFGKDTEFDSIDIAQRPKTYFPNRTKTSFAYNFGKDLHIELENIQIEIDFFSNYFNDLIALPWTFASITLLYRIIFKIKNYQVSLTQIIFTFLSFSIIFEWILPNLYPYRYIGDWIDILMYFLGSLLWWIINRFFAF